jgi:uncharacterized protein (DUF2336 family)
MMAAGLDTHELLRATPTSDGDRNAEAVKRITDLFLRDCERLRDEHVAVFDEVIGMLAARIEAHARAELAERLADVPNAPPNLIRRLARDEILVARPVLARSPRLTDDDLVDVALTRGRNHMIAITERETLSEIVTDVLVEHGDQVVIHAAARNMQARFSDHGFGRLVERSRGDEALQLALGDRPDLPLGRLKDLVGHAKAAARQRLVAALGARSAPLIDEAVENGAARVDADAYHALWNRLGASRPTGEAAERFQRGELCEADVYGFALAGNASEAETALNLLARVPESFGVRVLSEPQDDLLLIVCKSLDFGWDTVEALRRLKVRDSRVLPPAAKLKGSYETLSRVTADRVVRFLRARDPAAVAPALNLMASR